MKDEKENDWCYCYDCDCILAGWNIVQQDNDIELSELALENIDALAGCEVIGWISGDYRVTVYGCSWSCRSGGYFNCPY